MCLAIPMRIEGMDGCVARCSAKGVERDVNLLLLQEDDPAIGDHVLVHVGFAIAKITAEEASTTWDALDEAVALMD